MVTIQPIDIGLDNKAIPVLVALPPGDMLLVCEHLSKQSSIGL